MASAALSRDHHPSVHHKTDGVPTEKDPDSVQIPKEQTHAELDIGGKTVKLTNLQKPFWRQLGIKKGDLIQYYADVSRWLLPHIHNRAMVMKRYPNGAEGDFFYMKNAPAPRPEWIEIVSWDATVALRANGATGGRNCRAEHRWTLAIGPAMIDVFQMEENPDCVEACRRRMLASGFHADDIHRME